MKDGLSEHIKRWFVSKEPASFELHIRAATGAAALKDDLEPFEPTPCCLVRLRECATVVEPGVVWTKQSSFRESWSSFAWSLFNEDVGQDFYDRVLTAAHQLIETVQGCSLLVQQEDARSR